jgi:hypothetical protein
VARVSTNGPADTPGPAVIDSAGCRQNSGMSPVSRGRKTKKSRRRSTGGPAAGNDACLCPACTGSEFDPQLLIDDLTSDEFAESTDPLDAELAAAVFLAIGEGIGATFDEAFAGGIIPSLEARANTGALAMLLAFAAVADNRAAKVAAAAADRLAVAGVAGPAWAHDIVQPVSLTDCWRLVDSKETGSFLAGLFERAGARHTILVSVNHLDCGAAQTAQLVEAEVSDLVGELARTAGHGLQISRETLEPADFRWHVENALAARAVHDLGPVLREQDEAELEAQSEYRAVAMMLRARLRTVPEPNRPPAEHDRLGMGHGGAARSGLAALGRLLAGGGAGGRAMSDLPAALPDKRRKADGPAPVYQLKVSLRGAKPPIWRRLEVPADTDLARLHQIIQIAFEWGDSHLHVFETPYGEFGMADSELGHRPEAPVTLEQVAPGAGSKIRYTYDFGDDWEHDIVVEKVLDRAPVASYPRCTDGRRAAPPEDCGGVWGYAELQEIMADPTHPEHEDRLDWLGLGDAEEFEPAQFRADTVTEDFAYLRS